MSPGTAKIMAHLLQDQTPPISLQGLEASRSAVSPGQKDQLPCEQ
jgi:glycine/D-amino acid oxidase-like deaminating enzyme